MRRATGYGSLMVSEMDIWRSAATMIKRHGASAGEEASRGVRELLSQHDKVGAMTWLAIHRAVFELQTSKPEEDEPTH